MNIKRNKGPRSQAGGLILIELMTMVTIVEVLAAITLPVYNNYMIKSKLTEATATLDAVWVVVNEAYSFDNGISPSVSPPPIITQIVVSNAQYVIGIKYDNPGTSSDVGTVVTLSNTGNAQTDGHYLGMFGTGKADGTVVWVCATAQIADDSASGVTV